MSHAPEDRYDLILMDIQMPKQSEYPDCSHDGECVDEDRKKSFEAGMNGHVAKPIDMNMLTGMLDEIFSN